MLCLRDYEGGVLALNVIFSRHSGRVSEKMLGDDRYSPVVLAGFEDKPSMNLCTLPWCWGLTKMINHPYRSFNLFIL